MTCMRVSRVDLAPKVYRFEMGPILLLRTVVISFGQRPSRVSTIYLGKQEILYIGKSHDGPSSIVIVRFGDRKWGWKILQSILEHCRTPRGFSGLLDVRNPSSEKDDRMQAFFLSETLKYLFLLMNDVDPMPSDRFVLNTEAHPLKISL